VARGISSGKVAGSSASGQTRRPPTRERSVDYWFFVTASLDRIVVTAQSDRSRRQSSPTPAPYPSRRCLGTCICDCFRLGTHVDCYGLIPRGLLQPHPLHYPHARTFPSTCPCTAHTHPTQLSAGLRTSAPRIAHVHPPVDYPWHDLLPPGVVHLHFREAPCCVSCKRVRGGPASMTLVNY